MAAQPGTIWSATPTPFLIKDSSGSAEYRDAFAAIRKERPDALLLTGNEFDVLNSVAAGYDGALLGTGILIGGLIREGVVALKAGDSATAETLQEQSNEFLYGIFGRDIRLWLGGLKYTLKKLGIFNTEYMHLSFPLTNADRADVDRAIAGERENIFPQPVEH